MTEDEFNKIDRFDIEVFILGQWINVELPYNKKLTYRLRAEERRFNHCFI